MSDPSTSHSKASVGLRRKHSPLARGALLLLVGLAVACTGTSIADITQRPTEFLNRDVTVNGTVVESFSVMGNGAFRLDDGTGSIWVLSELGVPSEATENVSVTGELSERLDLEPFGIPLSIGSGPVLVAKSLATGR